MCYILNYFVLQLLCLDVDTIVLSMNQKKAKKELPHDAPAHTTASKHHLYSGDDQNSLELAQLFERPVNCGDEYITILTRHWRGTKALARPMHAHQILPCDPQQATHSRQ